MYLFQYVNDRMVISMINHNYKPSGEYRSRTDDLLRARQAL